MYVGDFSDLGYNYADQSMENKIGLVRVIL